MLGEPEQIVAIGQDVPGGEVHGQVSAVLRHAGGAQSAINTTIMADTPNRAVLAGTGATLVTDGAVLRPGDLVLTSAGKESTHAVHRARDRARGAVRDRGGGGAADRGGRDRHAAAPAGRSVATLGLVDEVRRQIGVTFLEESAPGVPR